MGKHGTSTGKASKKVKPNTPSKNSSAQSLPSFDESALSALTEKIEKGFNKGASSDAAQKPAKKDKNKPNGASQSKDTAPGKKRDAEGNVKTTAKSNKAAEGSARDILLQEILALGGTEEDLDLVEGVESEDEDVEGTQPKIDDPKFAKEFSKFIAGLGIEGQAQVDASEPEEEVDEADEDSEEWEEEPDTPKKAPKKAEEPIPQLVQAQPEKKSTKDVNRLVSSSLSDN
jgi:ribosome biogenesis protein MAK21